MKRLFNGEIRNWKRFKKFIKNNRDFCNVFIQKDNRIIYKSLPMPLKEAKELIQFVDINAWDCFAFRNLYVDA